MIYKIDKNGEKSIFADLGNDKSRYLIFGKEGNLYCSSFQSSEIYKINSEGKVSTFATLMEQDHISSLWWSKKFILHKSYGKWNL